MKSFFFAMSLVLFSLHTYAFSGGDHAGNGGDTCENRFLLIRADIGSWILNGGSSGLSLPPKITLTQYNQSMLQKMATAKVACTDDKILIGSAEKTCKNFVDPDGIPRILCNTDRFMKTSQSDQYVLVHHEFAGLSGFEINTGETSHYEISNQLSLYLEDQIVKKLALKPADYFTPGSCTGPKMTWADASKLIPPGITPDNLPDIVIATFDVHTRERTCDKAIGCKNWTLVPNRMGLGVHDKIQDRGSMQLHFDEPGTLSLIAANREDRRWLYLDCGVIDNFTGTCAVRANFLRDEVKASGTLSSHCAWLIIKQRDHSPENPTWTERDITLTSKY